jgi:hypothetical protein
VRPRGGARITVSEARSIVRDLLDEVRVQPAPPDDIYELYAREFIAFIDAARTKHRFLHK